MTEQGSTPDRPREHFAKVVDGAKSAASATDGFQALKLIVEATREAVVVTQTETSKRKRLATYEATEIERIRRAESVLKDYFAQVFAERRATFDEMFTRLDQALEQGNGEVVNIVMRGIVDVAKSSPLADVGDLSQIRAALDDPNQVWDL